MGVVCLDPGHQEVPDLAPEPMSPVCVGTKPSCARGSTGRRTGIPEHEIVLAVAIEARTLLNAAGLHVVMTRETADISLSNGERTRLANESGAGLCLKLHCDGVRASLQRLSWLRRGILTLVPGGECLGEAEIAAPSAAAATVVHRQIKASSGLRDRGIKRRADLTGFNWSRIPVVLVELGCLTYPAEERRLVSSSFQRQLAAGIASGVEGAFEQCL